MKKDKGIHVKITQEKYDEMRVQSTLMEMTVQELMRICTENSKLEIERAVDRLIQNQEILNGRMIELIYKKMKTLYRSRHTNIEILNRLNEISKEIEDLRWQS